MSTMYPFQGLNNDLRYIVLKITYIFVCLLNPRIGLHPVSLTPA